MKIDILGTEYEIEVQRISDNKTMKKNQWCGMCCMDAKKIIVADFDDDEYFDFSTEKEKDNYAKEVLRHEVIHAFLKESGLDDNSNSSGVWAKNEEMIDWIAIQFPKIQKVFEKLKCI